MPDKMRKQGQIFILYRFLAFLLCCQAFFPLLQRLVHQWLSKIVHNLSEWSHSILPELHQWPLITESRTCYRKVLTLNECTNEDIRGMVGECRRVLVFQGGRIGDPSR